MFQLRNTNADRAAHEELAAALVWAAEELSGRERPMQEEQEDDDDGCLVHGCRRCGEDLEL